MWAGGGWGGGQFIELLLTAVQTAATGKMKQGMKQTGNWKATEISLWAQLRVPSDREQEAAVSPLTEQQRLSFILMIFTTITKSPSIVHFSDQGEEFTAIIS